MTTSVNDLFKVSTLDHSRMTNVEGLYKATLTVNDHVNGDSTINVLLPGFLKSLTPKQALEVVGSFVRLHLPSRFNKIRMVGGINRCTFIDSVNHLDLTLVIDTASVSPQATLELTDFTSLAKAINYIQVRHSNLETLCITGQLSNTENNFISLHFDHVEINSWGTKLTPSQPAPSYLTMFREERDLLNLLQDAIKCVEDGAEYAIVYHFGSLLSVKDVGTGIPTAPTTPVIIK